jgi:hypothetical protein
MKNLSNYHERPIRRSAIGHASMPACETRWIERMTGRNLSEG